jgi:hypothetical protein
MKKKIDFAKVISWLGFVLRCPICSRKYNLQNIRVIESQQDEQYNEARILIHSDCQKCKSSVMFNIDISGPEIFSIGTITDLTGKDSAKFRARKPISVNEVINIHWSLKQFDGDLVKAIKI